MEDILIVVDTQNDFSDGQLGTPAARAALPAIVRKVKQHKGSIIVTQDTHGEDYLDTPEGKKLPVKHCIQGTWGWQLNSKLQDALKSKRVLSSVMKNTFGELRIANIIKCETDPGEALRITLIGFCTDICVISNALILKAALPNAEIIVDSSCCAGVTPELHEQALNVMRSCQIEVI